MWWKIFRQKNTFVMFFTNSLWKLDVSLMTFEIHRKFVTKLPLWRISRSLWWNPFITDATVSTSEMTERVGSGEAVFSGKWLIRLEGRALVASPS
jgi:hypothetical protein